MYNTGNFGPELCLPGGGGARNRLKAVAQYSSSRTAVLDNDAPHTVTFDATAFQRGIVPITYSEFRVATAGVYLLWAQVMIGHKNLNLAPGHTANSWFTVNGVAVAGAGGHVRTLLTSQGGIIAQAVVQLAAGDKIKLLVSGTDARMEPFSRQPLPSTLKEVPSASMTIQEI